MSGAAEVPHPGDVLSRPSLQGTCDGMDFLVRAASVLLGHDQAFLIFGPCLLPRAVPATGIEEAERPDQPLGKREDCSLIISNRTSLIINGQTPLSCCSSA